MAEKKQIEFKVLKKNQYGHRWILEPKERIKFRENYTLIGTQAEQKKFIGNAVEVNMSRVLCEALARKLMDKAA